MASCDSVRFSMGEESSRKICPELHEFAHHCTIAHPHLRSAFNTMLTAIQGPRRNVIVMVYGPTGVGKTTLRKLLERELTKQMLATAEENQGQLPFVSLMISAPSSKGFSWRDHFAELLLSLEDPFGSSHRAGAGVSHPSQRFVDRRSGGEIRQVAEQGILHRRPPVVMLDDAQHITKVASGRKLVDQTDVIKSIVEKTQTPHVLLGTYDLLHLRHLNDQWSRRCLEVHFGRYGCQPEPMQHFVNTVGSLQKYIPLPEEPDLLSHVSLLYERSLGCIGILKDWLSDVLNGLWNAHPRQHQVTRQDLERFAPSPRKCEAILNLILEGESKLDESEVNSSLLRQLLGVADVELPRPTSTQDHPTENLRQHRPRPGTSRPQRRPIGPDAAF